MMARQSLSILDRSLLSRRRFLATLAGSLGWMLCGFPPRVAARGISGMRSLISGRLLMGTVVEIEVNHPDLEIARQAVEASFNRMAKVDRLMSIFRPDSEISLVNHQGAEKPIQVGHETYTVLAEAERLAWMSGGALDITVGSLMRLWKLAEKRNQVPSAKEMDRALRLVGYDNLSLDHQDRSVLLKEDGMAIDLGGIAKGYAVDLAVEALQERGIQGAMVNAGGDLRVIGRTSDGSLWRIGLRHPQQPQSLLLSILVEDEAIATSGNYFNYLTIRGRRYGHLLNSRTGYPAESLLSATVIAKSAIEADGLATAAMIQGYNALELLQRIQGVQGIVISLLNRHPGKVLVQVTRDLRGRVELLDGSAFLEG